MGNAAFEGEGVREDVLARGVMEGGEQEQKCGGGQVQGDKWGPSSYSSRFKRADRQGVVSSMIK